MRDGGNDHESSWEAAYSYIKRQKGGIFKVSPKQAAALIIETVVREKDQFALYIGLGGRYLYNASGYRLSSTGHAGYDRISRYLYAPIGIRISNINSNRVIVFNLEYDYFIQGIQESKLSQAGPSYSDVTHSQDSGYGIKLTAGFFGVQKDKGGFELYLDLWDIDDSKPASGFYEPRNVTTEFGFRIYF